MNLTQFIQSCFNDCDSTSCLLVKLACKLIVFTIMVGVVTMAAGHLIEQWRMAA